MKKSIFSVLLLAVLVTCVFAASRGKAVDVQIGDLDNSTAYYYQFTTHTGVECIFMGDMQKGGLSCNWEKFNNSQKN